MNISFEKLSARGSSSGAQGLIRAPQRDAYTTRVDSITSTARTPVGLREGRLPERSPAGRSWAGQPDAFITVQGDHLSHSIPLPAGSVQSTRAPFEHGEPLQTALDCIAVLFAVLFISVTGIGIAAALFIMCFVVL